MDSVKGETKNIYAGREKEYKHEWYLRNRVKLREQNRKRYLENKDIILAKAKVWQNNNLAKTRLYKRRNKDTVRFGGNREAVIERDGNRCKLCGAGKDTQRLVIHHINEISYHNSNNPDNRINNLVLLCHSCHCSLHHKLRKLKLQSDLAGNRKKLAEMTSSSFWKVTK